MEDKIIRGKGIYLCSNFILNLLLLLFIDILFISLFIENKNFIFRNIFQFVIYSSFVIYTNFNCIKSMYYIKKCKVIFTKDSIILSNLKIRKKTKNDSFPIFYASSRLVKNVYIRALKEEKIFYKDIEKYGYNRDLDLHINYARGICFVIFTKEKYYYIDEFQFSKEQMNVIENILKLRLKRIKEKLEKNN